MHRINCISAAMGRATMREVVRCEMTVVLVQAFRKTSVGEPSGNERHMIGHTMRHAISDACTRCEVDHKTTIGRPTFCFS